MRNNPSKASFWILGINLSQIALSGLFEIIFYCHKDSLLVTEMSNQARNQFVEFYPELVKQLAASPTLRELPEMQEWIKKVQNV